MTKPEELRIVSADRFSDSIVIGFSDGRCGRYYPQLLYSILPQAEELFEQDLAIPPGDEEAQGS